MELATSALAMFAQRPWAHDLVHSSGAVQHLVAALNPLQPAVVVEHAANALGSLATSGRCRAAIRGAGGIGVLVRLLRRDTDSIVQVRDLFSSCCPSHSRSAGGDYICCQPDLLSTRSAASRICLQPRPLQHDCHAGGQPPDSANQPAGSTAAAGSSRQPKPASRQQQAAADSPKQPAGALLSQPFAIMLALEQPRGAGHVKLHQCWE